MTFVYFLFAFTSSSTLQSSPQIKKTSNRVDLNPILYPLYIDNSKKNSQLDDLLSLEKKGFILDHFKKIIFQFFYKDDNYGFTLTAYIGPRKQQKFESSVIQLQPYITCSINTAKIGPNVYLGDFEFIDQKVVIKKLDSLALDKTKNAFIVFYPSIKTVTMNGISRINVNYKLYAVTALTEICNISTIKDSANLGTLTVKNVGASTNPSPPYGGN